jgi:hypothetical protein
MLGAIKRESVTPTQKIKWLPFLLQQTKYLNSFKTVKTISGPEAKMYSYFYVSVCVL